MRKYLKIFNKHYRKCLLALGLGSLLVSCNPVGNTGSGDVLVRVYDKYLYASDLEGVVPPGLSVRDSLTMVRTFIQNWVDNELIIKKAEENLPDERKDFSDELNEYRNSLIIYEYEKMLVQQQLDTVVSLDAISKYYLQHRNNFTLSNDVVVMKYLTLYPASPAVSELRQYIRSDELADKDSLALYCSKYALDFSLFEDRWLSIEELKELVPVDDYNYELFMAGERYYELNDTDLIYMIRFIDYKPADSIAPVGVVENDIREMILNKRKNNLIRNMQQTVLKDAIEHNQVEIF
ncbi:MAG: hypothetical protein RQ761_05755 [Bacteroidales bacterium]|nr:hypothetical protein [Bacteroidales bacterium]